MTDIKNIGWLKIIVSSLRDSLKIKVQKWINVYTNFLLTQVKVILTNLQNFNKNTADGIVENPNDHPKDKDLLWVNCRDLAIVLASQESMDVFDRERPTHRIHHYSVAPNKSMRPSTADRMLPSRHTHQIFQQSSQDTKKHQSKPNNPYRPLLHCSAIWSDSCGEHPSTVL